LSLLCSYYRWFSPEARGNPGRIHWGSEAAGVELKPFNDRALNRDLETLCAKVVKVQPHLPDGRHLLFRLQGARILHLDALEKEVAWNPGLMGRKGSSVRNVCNVTRANTAMHTPRSYEETCTTFEMASSHASVPYVANVMNACVDEKMLT
jgi:hypothetical protein